jgi:hypothetical protein
MTEDGLSVLKDGRIYDANNVSDWIMSVIKLTYSRIRRVRRVDSCESADREIRNGGIA